MVHSGKHAQYADSGSRGQLRLPGAANSLLVVTLLVALTLVAGCSSRTAAPEARYVPAGDLLDVVKDFQRLAKEDTYRFPIPKDITGINIMKATLVRLGEAAGVAVDVARGEAAAIVSTLLTPSAAGCLDALYRPVLGFTAEQ